MKTEMYFLMTIDVESFSIPLNRYDFDTGKDGYEIGLPLLLDLLAKHDLQSTFYFTGEWLRLFPNLLNL